MTVREISAITGLSPATVYRIFKDPDNASRKSYEKVQRVVGDIKKNPEKLRQVYIVLPHINNFYTAFLVEAISLLTKQGIQAIPFITEENKKAERDFFSGISFSQRIGLIWNPTDEDSRFSFMARIKNKPIILTLNRTLSTYEADLSITLDNREALEKIVDILVKQNCKKLLFVNGPNIYNTARERMEGFTHGVEKYGHVQWDVLFGDFTDWKRTHHLLISNSHLLRSYDAVISANESISYGILKACKDLGVSIPADLRFIGIDYAPTFEALSLSMVYFSPQKIAQKAVEFLIKKSLNREFVMKQKFMAHIELLGSEE